MVKVIDIRVAIDEKSVHAHITNSIAYGENGLYEVWSLSTVSDREDAREVIASELRKLADMVLKGGER